MTVALSFNDRVRRAVEAYKLAELEQSSDGWKGGVHWCNKCGFVSASTLEGGVGRMHSTCSEDWHFVDDNETIKCIDDNPDIKWVDTEFVGEKLHGLFEEYLAEYAEEEAVVALFQQVPEEVYV